MDTTVANILKSKARAAQPTFKRICYLTAATVPYRPDDWLVVRLRLGHRRSREMAIELLQNGFPCRE
jgi:hypothetical protein